MSLRVRAFIHPIQNMKPKNSDSKPKKEQIPKHTVISAKLINKNLKQVSNSFIRRLQMTEMK